MFKHSFINPKYNIIIREVVIVASQQMSNFLCLSVLFSSVF